MNGSSHRVRSPEERKRPAPPAPPCRVQGCLETPTERKPFCFDHLDLMPYVRKVKRELAGREDESLPRRGRPIEATSSRSCDILSVLAGAACSPKRLAIKAEISPDALERYLEALARAGVLRVLVLGSRRGTPRRVVEITQAGREVLAREPAGSSEGSRPSLVGSRHGGAGGIGAGRGARGSSRLREPRGLGRVAPDVTIIDRLRALLGIGDRRIRAKLGLSPDRRRGPRDRRGEGPGPGIVHVIGEDLLSCECGEPAIGATWVDNPGQVREASGQVLCPACAQAAGRRSHSS